VIHDAAIVSAVDSTIRVDVSLLDTLMTRVGELVLARNQIMQFTSELGNTDLLRTTQRLNLITTELQEGVMKTRMQPIGNVWSKFPRLVRDLAVICGKEVRIEMEGKETELDKTIIEAIKDPLTHLVRNTVDHGIEKPEVRRLIGKPVEGCLTLRAFHEGGQVIIDISNDGTGLNLDRIRSKAIEKGLVSQEQIARMQEQEIAQLIFLPGFSTAEKVSNVSGRGVKGRTADTDHSWHWHQPSLGTAHFAGCPFRENFKGVSGVCRPSRGGLISRKNPAADSPCKLPRTRIEETSTGSCP